MSTASSQVCMRADSRAAATPANRARSSLLISGTAVLLLYLGGSTASGAPIAAEVIGCVGQLCTVEPLGGPVDLDPSGFTLEVEWSPEHIELIEDPGGHGLLRLFFDFTGPADGTEHFPVVLTLLDQAGNPLALNVQFDDFNTIVTPAVATYQIFGVLNNQFFVHGFTLGLSDVENVDTLQWARATFFPAAAGISTVPEPSTLFLLGTGLTLAGVIRSRRRT
jgi:hypothetical protein